MESCTSLPHVYIIMVEYYDDEVEGVQTQSSIDEVYDNNSVIKL